jgi:hypothetical protein
LDPKRYLTVRVYWFPKSSWIAVRNFSEGVSVNIVLTSDQATVLDAFLSRLESSGQVSFEHAAEYLAVQALSAQLEKQLVEPLSREYDRFLATARNNLASGFEGTVPGLR